MTGWKEIFQHLEQGGFDVFPLGQHKGKCESPYLVLRNNGAGHIRSIEAQEYEVLIYYPFEHYSSFEGYIGKVKDRMNELYPMVKLVDDQQPHYPDDDVQAYMTSLIYRVPRISKANRMKLWR